jgi:hypothetical protein
MIRKIAAVIALTALLSPAFAQETTPKKTSARPDIPGTFVLEFGFNGAIQPPDNIDLNFFGTKSFNLYYQYDFRLFKSKFSVVPGIGFAFERYKFKDGAVLGYNSNDSLTMLSPTEAGYTSLKKSQLITNIVEVPIEFCFRSNPDDPARSFRASIGGRFGYMFDSFTKVKYREEGETKKIKDKQNYNLNAFRYGVTAKVGFGAFNLFGYYNLNSLFESGKGPGYKGTVTDFNTFTVGVSLAAF